MYKKIETECEENLLEALALMRNQYCGENWHSCMSAWENCVAILQEYWLIDWEYWEAKYPNEL